MRRFRFNIASLLGVILLFGVGFAALRESTELWESGAFTLTIGVLLISILLGIHRVGKGRTFWLGFAIFGSAYLGLSLVPSIEPRLITSKALAYLASKVPRSSRSGLAYFDFDNDGAMDLFVVNNSQPNSLLLKKGNDLLDNVTPAAGSHTTWFSNILMGSSGKTENFVRIGHALLALIVAFLGGLLSRYLHVKNREPHARPVNPRA